MSLLVGLALSTLVSEDLALLTAGALVAQGEVGLPAAIAACIAGIFGGDILLYLAGRLGGRWLFRSPWLRRFISRDAVERASEWMAGRTFSVVFLSRFTPGLRLPVYVAAGLLSWSFGKFAAALLLAAFAWTPLVVVLSAVLGESMESFTGFGLAGLLMPVAIAAVALHGARRFARSAEFRRFGRRLRGFWLRKTRWEFLPAWLSYIPVVAYILCLAVRHRSLTLFTAANPGIPCGGGVAGESKAFILQSLADGGAPVGRFAVVAQALSAADRLTAVKRFLQNERLDLPVVLKPDRGERGSGVAVIRSQAEMRDYLKHATDDIIVQEYIGGKEFGIFYYRRPTEKTGRIFSVTRKEFPSVTGDGARTLEELILADPRAVSLADAYLAACRRRPHEVIAAGEQVQLIEIGSHCRGAVFLDGADLCTAALSAAADRAAKGMPGFFFGRFDVRTPSIESLRRGEFCILELNGVTSEATHVYDPKISVREAYRTLFAQWSIAFEIGLQNRQRGYEPESVLRLLQIIRQRRPARAGVSSDSWLGGNPVRDAA